MRITIPPQELLLNVKIKTDFLRRCINILKSEGIRWHDCWIITIFQNPPYMKIYDDEKGIITAWLKFLYLVGGKSLEEIDINQIFMILQPKEENYNKRIIS